MVLAQQRDRRVVSNGRRPQVVPEEFFELDAGLLGELGYGVLPASPAQVQIGVVDRAVGGGVTFVCHDSTVVLEHLRRDGRPAVGEDPDGLLARHFFWRFLFLRVAA